MTCTHEHGHAWVVEGDRLVCSHCDAEAPVDELADFAPTVVEREDDADRLEILRSEWVQSTGWGQA